jgi:enoyl-CoA hydratase/carnithine racemase
MQHRDEYRKILVNVSGHIATVTLNNPERKNALGPAMVNELLWALDDAKEDAEVRAVVLTGAGKAFSAGADLSQMGGPSDGPKLDSKGDYADLLLRFTTIGKPIVARIPGPAMGGGLGLVASSDFAIACESAVFGTPEIHRGLFPMQIMAVLERIVPRRKLIEMMLLGDKIPAGEAQELGLITRAVPDDKLDEEVAALAGQLAARSPTALRMGLAAFHHQSGKSLEEALPYLRGQLGAILGTADAREGLSAFMQKREPKWTGK